MTTKEQGMKRFAGAAVVVLMLAGCGGHEVDRRAWGKELEAQGVTVKDWDKLEKTTRDLCNDDESQLQMFLAVSKDSGTPSMKTIETDFRNVCPDRLDAFNAAMKEMADSTAEAKVACTTPKSERTDQQELMAEALGC